MLDNLQKLFRYRALVQSLVARELKARYRGSILGVFWSFINPLLTLLIFTFVFTYVLPGARDGALEPYPLFLLCGILPWTWFESSLLESSNVLIAGGNLIRKVLFPAEVLPIVTVLAGLVHFCLGLVVIAGFVLYYRVAITGTDLLWLPIVIAIQLLFTTGLALLVSALTVHFRDMRDLLANVMKLWFYATPIVYAMSQVPQAMRPVLALNPFAHLAGAYREVLFTAGPFTAWRGLLATSLVAVLTFLIGYFVFDRLRDSLAEEV